MACIVEEVGKKRREGIVKNGERGRKVRLEMGWMGAVGGTLALGWSGSKSWSRSHLTSLLLDCKYADGSSSTTTGRPLLAVPCHVQTDPAVVHNVFADDLPARDLSLSCPCNSLRWIPPDKYCTRYPHFFLSHVFSATCPPSGHNCGTRHMNTYVGYSLQETKTSLHRIE